MTDPTDTTPAPPAIPVQPDDARGVPTKCVACDRELSSTVVCDYCHSINPMQGPTDYFSLLGVPRRYDLDADSLRRRYLALNRHAHPDFHADDTDDVRDLSLTVASAINDAYRTLADPIDRASYLLQLLGGAGSAEDKSTPPGFLEEVAAMQEKLFEARAEGDDASTRELGDELSTRLDAMVGEIGELFTSFDTRVGCEAVRQDELTRIRRRLNAISYIRRMLAVARGG